MNEKPRMPRLQSCRGGSEIPAAQPSLREVRGTTDLVPEVAPRDQAEVGIDSPVPGGDRCVVGLWALGERSARNCRWLEGRPTYWPGRLIGVRQPELGETPLSDEEAIYLTKTGLQYHG